MIERVYLPWDLNHTLNRLYFHSSMLKKILIQIEETNTLIIRRDRPVIKKIKTLIELNLKILFNLS